jgi:AcrR family transcriptional regulator
MNRERILDIAAKAFAREGADASLKAIAKEAGVGIGTLYRRFPTREELIEATYRNETVKLCDAAPELLAAAPPLQALRAWMDRFVGYMATKHGMAESLRAILVTDDDLRMHTRHLLTDALGSLVTAGITDGAIRSDADHNDVLMALGGITLIAGEPNQHALAGRLLDLLIDSLRYCQKEDQ